MMIWSYKGVTVRFGGAFEDEAAATAATGCCAGAKAPMLMKSPFEIEL